MFQFILFMKNIKIYKFLDVVVTRKIIFKEPNEFLKWIY